MPSQDKYPFVVILSYGLGGGHHRVASLVKESLLERGCRVKLIYLEDVAGVVFNLIFFHGYLLLYRFFPFLWGGIYRRSLKWRNRGVTPALLLRRASRRVLKLLDSPDLIIATQINCSEIAAFLKKTGKIKSLVFTIVTDYDALPVWAQAGVDIFFLPENDIAERLGEFLHGSGRALSFGIPVDKRFNNSKKDKEFLRGCGLCRDKKTILLMGGSMGILGMEPIVNGIIRHQDLQLIAVCGKNAKLKRKLEYIAPRFNGRLMVLGFTEKVPELMASCDILITKSGGLTLAEAKVSGIPILLLPPIQGQEEANYDYFIKKGWAHPVPDTEKLGENIQVLYRKEDKAFSGYAADRIINEVFFEFQKGVLNL